MAKKVYLGVRSEPAFFTLLGISCHLRDYRLSYLFNFHLGFTFVKNDDLRIISSPAQGEAEFSFYSYRDEERYNSYYLIANRSPSFTLVPEMKQFDFLLIVEGRFNKPEKDAMLRTIRKLPNILTVFETRMEEIRNIENLLTDVEMHITNIRKLPKIKYQPKIN
jgi:hypothetical protein